MVRSECVRNILDMSEREDDLLLSTVQVLERGNGKVVFYQLKLH